MEFFKMKFVKLYLFLCVGILIGSCEPNNIDPEPVIIDGEWFPEHPKNIEVLNTVYDDYNSNINVTGDVIHLYYSTNKDNQGDNFDISSRCIEAFMNLDNGKFRFDVSNSEAQYAFDLLPKINTEFDEYGPFLFYSDSLMNAHTWWYFMYANNESGNFDIRFTAANNGDWGTWHSQKQISGPFVANVLNSEFDDYYPTINEDFSKLFFSSNRDQDFDIYEIDAEFKNFVEWLKTGTNIPKRNSILSGLGDEKCPYIKGNLMVFVSNNSAGYGGYDLWYSEFKDGKWNTPQNFGPEINTEYDEYRPAIEYFQESENDLMIFSSNRPGGKGEFDLYYTGIDRMIK